MVDNNPKWRDPYWRVAVSSRLERFDVLDDKKIVLYRGTNGNQAEINAFIDGYLLSKHQRFTLKSNHKATQISFEKDVQNDWLPKVEEGIFTHLGVSLFAGYPSMGAFMDRVRVIDHSSQSNAGTHPDTGHKYENSRFVSLTDKEELASKWTEAAGYTYRFKIYLSDLWLGSACEREFLALGGTQVFEVHRKPFNTNEWIKLG